MMTGTGGSVNNKEGCFTNQEVTRDQRMGTGNRDL
jgi:hypothetical protein